MKVTLDMRTTVWTGMPDIIDFSHSNAITVN